MFFALTAIPPRSISRRTVNRSRSAACSMLRWISGTISLLSCVVW